MTGGVVQSAILSIEDVTFSYDGSPVLAGVGLSLGKGQSACLVGPNGGGKTTLMRLILGLIEPDAGRVRVWGMAPKEARRRIGYVPQQMRYDPSFPIRVDEVVGMACLGEGRGPRADRIDGVLEAVGLSEVKTRWFKNLSSGQRQRVLIARALATEPEMLILDEPTSSTDAHASEAILGLIRSIRERMTVIVATHDTAVVSEFLDRIVCVNRTVHLHPATEKVDGDLMLHIIGYPLASGHFHHEGHEGHEGGPTRTDTD